MKIVFPKGLRGVPIRRGMELFYGDLFEELRLSPEVIDRFISLLEKQQAENATLDTRPFTDPQLGFGPFLAMKSKHEAEIEALLGPEGLARYIEYPRNVGSRFQVNELRDRLARTPAPLSKEQKAQLFAILVEERERVRPPSFPRPGDDALTEAQYAKAYADWEDACERRVRERASVVLTPRQLARLTRSQKVQAAARHVNVWFKQARAFVAR